MEKAGAACLAARSAQAVAMDDREPRQVGIHAAGKEHATTFRPCMLPARGVHGSSWPIFRMPHTIPPQQAGFCSVQVFFACPSLSTSAFLEAVIEMVADAPSSLGGLELLDWAGQLSQAVKVCGDRAIVVWPVALPCRRAPACLLSPQCGPSSECTPTFTCLTSKPPHTCRPVHRPLWIEHRSTRHNSRRWWGPSPSQRCQPGRSQRGLRAQRRWRP